MRHEQRWELRYARKKADGTWETRVCYPKSEEARDKNVNYCKTTDGYRLISCKKMYPFDMWNNQHNLVLIYNICFNRMGDMDMGEIPYDKDEYERMDALKEKAGRLAGMMTAPITWLVWDDYKDAKELSMMAQIHRAEACIENGRPDLVQYC